MVSQKKEHIGQQVSHGVESLIEQLREQGVHAGQVRAEVIVKEAQAKADQLIVDAELQAKCIVEKAQADIHRLEAGGKDALEIAMRDILLKLKARLTELVGNRVQRLLAAELNQETFLKELILEVAGKVRSTSAVDASPTIEFKLPSHLIGLDELRHHPIELQEGSLSHFILSIAADVLREGVSFSEADDDFAGLKLELQDRDVVVDLTDERLSEILLQHLQPRFRAILEGIVK